SSTRKVALRDTNQVVKGEIFRKGAEWTHRDLNPISAVQDGVFPLDEQPVGRVKVIPDGVEPPPPGCGPGVLAAEPRDRRSDGPSAGGRRQSARVPGLSLLPTADIPSCSVAEVGVEPTDLTRLSTWPLCRLCVLGH